MLVNIIKVSNTSVDLVHLLPESKEEDDILYDIIEEVNYEWSGGTDIDLGDGLDDGHLFRLDRVEDILEKYSIKVGA